MSIAEAQGYEGKSSGTIAEAVNALGSVMGGGGSGGGGASLAAIAPFSIAGTDEELTAMEWETFFVDTFGLYYARVPFLKPDGSGDVMLVGNLTTLGLLQSHGVLKSNNSDYYGVKKFESGAIFGGNRTNASSFSSADFKVYTEFNSTYGGSVLYLVYMGGKSSAEEAIASVKAEVERFDFLGFSVIDGDLINAIKSFSA